MFIILPIMLCCSAQHFFLNALHVPTMLNVLKIMLIQHKADKNNNERVNDYIAA